MKRTTVRLAGIDSFRVAAILAVITIHTSPFEELPTARGVIDQIARFAVPYFLVISGFLYEKRFLRTDTPVVAFEVYLKRISTIFIFWSAAYLLVPEYSLISQLGLIKGMYHSFVHRLSLVYENPLHALLAGTSIHLWFLPALLISVAILTIGVATKKENIVLYIAMLLYILGLLADPYSATQFGINFPFEEKRLLFCPVFVIAGFILAKHISTLRNPIGVGMLLVGVGLTVQLLEGFLLWHLFDRPLISNNFLLGTIPFGMGISLLALSLPNLGSNIGVAVIGKYTLGIYCVHVAVINSPFSWLLAPYFSDFLWQILQPMAIYVISLAIVVLMAKTPYLSKVVI